jgi:hypothetical protein
MDNIKESIRREMVKNKIDPAICPKCGKLFVLMINTKEKMKRFEHLNKQLSNGDNVECKLHNQVGIVWN